MVIDSRVAGLGDAWMRLAALYTLTGMGEGRRHAILVAPPLVPLARFLFSDRLDVDSAGHGDVVYTHLGIRHSLGKILRGRRYVFPFFWLLRELRPRSTIKDRLNDMAVRVLSRSGRILLPRERETDFYQGFMELRALVPFKDFEPKDLARQASRDLSVLTERMDRRFGAESSASETLVFPGGSAHQTMPLDWAAENMPKCTFAFHEKDASAEGFLARKLKVVRFGSPESMLECGKRAERVFVTDSFPSHVWQFMGGRTTVLLSQQPRSRVVHPGFPERQVLASRAPCCPCRSLDRANHVLCDAGRLFCLTWASAEYTARVRDSLSKKCTSYS